MAIINWIVTQFKRGQAVILIILGFILFSYGTFGVFQPNSMWREFNSGLGKALLASGVFAVILKSMQFTGVFKEELHKIIYETKYLVGRNDLEETWERVSKVMFKDKFPRISKDIMNDVKKIYFPTDHVLYYDNYDQTVEIDLIDAEENIIKVTQHSSFTIYANDLKTFDHRTSNSIIFKEDKAEVRFTVLEFKVNGIDKTPILEELLDRNKLRTTLTVQLAGSSEYKFHTKIEKIYSLNSDNEIGVFKDFLIHDFKLKVLLKGNLSIRFLSIGTLKQFANKTFKVGNCYEYEYKGIIYPKQGYMIYVSRK